MMPVLWLSLMTGTSRYAALFQKSRDRLRLPSLPCVRFGDQLVRLVLRDEHIDFRRSST